MKTIYVAGGCFWGVQEYFRRLKGTIDTVVGYANGDLANPTYEMLKRHEVTHAETVKLTYDENILPLTKIAEHFLRIVDPFAVDHQGEDYGHQYRTGIYYLDEGDGKIVREFFDKALQAKTAIEVLPLANFYDAETYHQNYLVTNPNGYCHIDFSLIKEDEKK